MQFKFIPVCVCLIYAATIDVQCLSAQTITKNQMGTQGDYYYQFWLDFADVGKGGTMTLGDDGNFSCSWDSVNNILFKKGRRPGTRDQIVTYSADYKSSGNSNLGVYGCTEDPFVEYYIIDNWGPWKPPGIASQGTFLSDSGVYDIYVSYRSISMQIFKQFWSVRQTIRTSGTITCANHFDAWAVKNVGMGELYEVMFFVEGYQGSGTADITMSMSSGSTAINDKLNICQSRKKQSGVFNSPIQTVLTGGSQSFTFKSSLNRSASLNVYNFLGQQIGSQSGDGYSSGKFFYSVKTAR